MKRFLEIAKWTLWLSALVGAVRKVLSFSRIYMRRNIGHEHMHKNRIYLCLWFWGGNYIFITDVYGKDYNETYRMSCDLNRMDIMMNYEWSFTTRTWSDNHGSDPRYTTMRFNELPHEILNPVHRWMIWRHLLMCQVSLTDLNMPDQFYISIEK